MAGKTAKKKEEKQANPNDYSLVVELDEGVGILAEQNDSVREWRRDVIGQLIMWRNIPHPQQVSYGDESVMKIARARGVVNPLQPKGQAEKKLVERIRQGVITKSYQEREGLVNTVVTLSLIKSAFIFDDKRDTAVLRPDIAKLIGQDMIDAGVEKYFSNQPDGKFEPVFPTLDRGVPAEMAIALASVLLEEFPGIGEQIREKLAEIDAEIDARETGVVVYADEAGFQSE
jgi:hypothetical protein